MDFLLAKCGFRRGIHVHGAVPMICDGTQTYEDSFFYYPEFATAYLSTSTGGSLLNGQYTWAVVYKHFDASGQLTRSSPVFTAQSHDHHKSNI